MAIRASTTLAAGFVGALLLSLSPAFACDAATIKAHPKWVRPGGYCEISADLHGHSSSAGLGGWAGVSNAVQLYPPHFFSSNSGGYSGNGYTVQPQPNGTLVYRSNGDGTTFVFQTTENGGVRLLN